MGFLEKKRYILLIFFLLTTVFFLSRLYNIMSLPLFVDEAIYIRWAQIANFDPNMRFISLLDGKQPLFIWLTLPFMRLVTDDLLAGRLVSVFAGFLSMLGLFFLTQELFKSKKIGIITSFLYIIYPMALVYDRMALYDSLVGTCAVWILYLEVLLVRKIRLDLSLLLAFALGAGILTKSSGFLSIYFSPILLLLFDFKQKVRLKRLIKWILLMLLSAGIAYLYYSVLRLSALFYMISQKNAVFIYPLKEWIEHPLRFLIGNLLGQWDWMHRYMGFGFIGLFIISFFITRKNIKEKLLLFLWFLFPFTALALFGKVLYPRFIFFMTLFLLPLIGFSFIRLSEIIKHKLLFTLFCVIIFSLSLRTDFFILTNIQRAPIPHADTDQYINSWPAGGGVTETVSFLKSEAQKGKIYVLAEGTFGSLPLNLIEIYLDANPKINKRGIYPIPEIIPSDVYTMSKYMPVYVIFNQMQSPPKKWPLKPIAKFRKGIGQYYMSIYQVVYQQKT